MQTNSVQSFTKLHIASVGKGNICWSHHFLKSLPLCCLTPVIPFMLINVSLFPETRFVAPQHWTSPDRPRKTKTASSLFFCQVHEKCMWRRRPVKYNFKPNNSAQKQMVMPSRKENRTFWSNLVVQNCYSNRQSESAWAPKSKESNIFLGLVPDTSIRVQIPVVLCAVCLVAVGTSLARIRQILSGAFDPPSGLKFR